MIENNTTKRLVQELTKHQRKEVIKTVRKEVKLWIALAYLSGFGFGLFAMSIIFMFSLYVAAL